MTKRFLTKSRFIRALECPTKLFYTGKSEYADQKLQNTFLQSLAKGGFQVGELAKQYINGGIEIEELNHDVALEKTNALLLLANTTIYEAAFAINNLFIRADIIDKKGNEITLYEVKAKSFDSNVDKISNEKGDILSNWKPYFYDIAFQKYVISKAYPNFKIASYLVFADKAQKASVEGLNQKFYLFEDANGRTRIKVKGFGKLSKEDLGTELLVRVNVTNLIETLLAQKSFDNSEIGSFTDVIHFYAKNYEADNLIEPILSGKCKNCEFKTKEVEKAKGLKSGFEECWEMKAKFSKSDFQIPSILDIWDLRNKEEYIRIGKFFQKDLTRTDLEGKSKKIFVQGLSRIDRQELQITKSKTGDNKSYTDISGLKRELSSFSFPLHFIDFETTAVAIPFHKGNSPYEQIAFQFSHHIVYENGKIEHSGQWLNIQSGFFPNFEFVRALKLELEKDSGTIFRYANHENAILNAIYRQLRSSQEDDKDELCNWIMTITQSTGKSSDNWIGIRNMIDILQLVKQYYYSPTTQGSNSIKHILPAIINDSEFLKSKYSLPIYGEEIKSKNFSKHSWIQFDKGKVLNPYSLLDPLFKDYDDELMDQLVMDESAEINEGGAAMMAYASMQFSEMRQEEKERIQLALFKYCELDTFAMVMIWEEWNNMIL